MWSSVRLLTDEQSCARTSTARFIVRLPWIPQDDVNKFAHANHALQLLFKHVVSSLVSSSPVCYQLVVSWLNVTAVSDVIAANTSTQSVCCSLDTTVVANCDASASWRYMSCL